jgi:hypothetical protein
MAAIEERMANYERSLGTPAPQEVELTPSEQMAQRIESYGVQLETDRRGTTLQEKEQSIEEHGGFSGEFGVTGRAPGDLLPHVSLDPFFEFFADDRKEAMVPEAQDLPEMIDFLGSLSQMRQSGRPIAVPVSSVSEGGRVVADPKGRRMWIDPQEFDIDIEKIMAGMAVTTDVADQVAIIKSAIPGVEFTLLPGEMVQIRVPHPSGGMIPMMLDAPGLSSQNVYQDVLAAAQYMPGEKLAFMAASGLIKGAVKDELQARTKTQLLKEGVTHFTTQLAAGTATDLARQKATEELGGGDVSVGDALFVGGIQGAASPVLATLGWVAKASLGKVKSLFASKGVPTEGMMRADGSLTAEGVDAAKELNIEDDIKAVYQETAEAGAPDTPIAGATDAVPDAAPTPATAGSDAAAAYQRRLQELREQSGATDQPIIPNEERRQFQRIAELEHKAGTPEGLTPAESGELARRLEAERAGVDLTEAAATQDAELARQEDILLNASGAEGQAARLAQEERFTALEIEANKLKQALEDTAGDLPSDSSQATRVHLGETGKEVLGAEKKRQHTAATANFEALKDLDVDVPLTGQGALDLFQDIVENERLPPARIKEIERIFARYGLLGDAVEERVPAVLSEIIDPTTGKPSVISEATTTPTKKVKVGDNTYTFEGGVTPLGVSNFQEFTAALNKARQSADPTTERWAIDGMRRAFDLEVDTAVHAVPESGGIEAVEAIRKAKRGWVEYRNTWASGSALGRLVAARAADPNLPQIPPEVLVATINKGGDRGLIIQRELFEILDNSDNPAMKEYAQGLRLAQLNSLIDAGIESTGDRVFISGDKLRSAIKRLHDVNFDIYFPGIFGDRVRSLGNVSDLVVTPVRGIKNVSQSGHTTSNILGNALYRAADQGTLGAVSAGGRAIDEATAVATSQKVLDGVRKGGGTAAVEEATRKRNEAVMAYLRALAASQAPDDEATIEEVEGSK